MNSVLSPICYVLGYATGASAFWWLARRRGLDTFGVACVMAAGLIGGLFFGNAVQWLLTGGPGKTVIGAIAGGYLTIFVYKRWIGLVRPLGDLFAFAMSSGEAVGRWGCYFAGCCYGKISTGPLSIWQHGAWRYPTQIYASLAAAFTFAVLVYAEKRRLFPENGLFYLQGAMFCCFRFVIEYYRVGDVIYDGLTAAQIACVAGLLFFGYKLKTMQGKALA